METSPAEAEVIFNRASIALARSQKLIASWLPPKAADEIANEKTEQELQEEENRIFTPVPEKLGLGAPLPNNEADGAWNRSELNSNDKLRRQLLGQKAKAAASSKYSKGQSNKFKPSIKSSNVPTLDSESEEESRSSLRTKGKPGSKIGSSSGENTRVGKRKPGSYLDEILSTRAKKGKRQEKSG